MMKTKLIILCLASCLHGLTYSMKNIQFNDQHKDILKNISNANRVEYYSLFKTLLDSSNPHKDKNFRKMATVLHPDKVKGKEEVFKDLAAIHEGEEPHLDIQNLTRSQKEKLHQLEKSILVRKRQNAKQSRLFKDFTVSTYGMHIADTSLKSAVDKIIISFLQNFIPQDKQKKMYSDYINNLNDHISDIKDYDNQLQKEIKYLNQQSKKLIRKYLKEKQ